MRTRVSVSWVKLNCPSTESERGNATHRLPRETWRSAVSAWYATWPDHTAQQTIHFPKPAVSTINGPQSLLPITPDKSTLHILPTSTLVSVCCQSLLPRIAPPSPTLPSGAVRVSSHFLHFSHSLSLSLFYLGFSLHTFCISSTFCRFLILSISLLTVLRSGFVRNSDRGMLGILRDGEPMGEEMWFAASAVDVRHSSVCTAAGDGNSTCSSVLLLFELFLLFEYVTRNVLCTGD